MIAGTYYDPRQISRMSWWELIATYAKCSEEIGIAWGKGLDEESATVETRHLICVEIEKRLKRLGVDWMAHGAGEHAEPHGLAEERKETPTTS